MTGVQGMCDITHRCIERQLAGRKEDCAYVPKSCHVSLLLPSHDHLCVQIIDAVGHNDSNPLRLSAIHSAHETPHILLWTNHVHNQTDLRSLVKTPALCEAFRAFKEGTGAAGISTSLGSRSVAVCVSW